MDNKTPEEEQLIETKSKQTEVDFSKLTSKPDTISTWSSEKKRVAQLMGERVRITIEDGREYEGDLFCMDDSYNFILENSSLLKPLPFGEIVREEVHVGQILINGRDITGLKMKQAVLEQDFTTA